MSETMEAVAYGIAFMAHRGQKDKGGQPYIGHPVRVSEAVRTDMLSRFERGHSMVHTAVATALLHDVLEDTDLTSDDLIAAGISEKIVALVEALTQGPDQTREDYYDQIRATRGDARAIVFSVKRHDVIDNTSPSRLALLDQETQLRLIKKYANTQKELQL